MIEYLQLVAILFEMKKNVFEFVRHL